MIAWIPDRSDEGVYILYHYITLKYIHEIFPKENDKVVIFLIPCSAKATKACCMVIEVSNIITYNIKCIITKTIHKEISEILYLIACTD